MAVTVVAHLKNKTKKQQQIIKLNKKTPFGLSFI